MQYSGVCVGVCVCNGNRAFPCETEKSGTVAGSSEFSLFMPY